MNIELKYKLYLIDPINYPFPEWNMCENLLGNLGNIKMNEYVYIDGKFIYKYSNKYKDYVFCISSQNIHSFFDKFELECIIITNIIKLFIEYRYNIRIDSIIFYNK
jgi:hypothetical protein